jgi:plasmid stabilization system protein ParE
VNDYELSPVALEDIDEIAAQIAEKNKPVALRFIEAAYRCFAFLARHLHSGHRRPDLTDRSVFFWPLARKYAVIYRKADPLQIIHVRPWRQDLVGLLAREADDQ